MKKLFAFASLFVVLCMTIISCSEQLSFPDSFEVSGGEIEVSGGEITAIPPAVTPFPAPASVTVADVDGTDFIIEASMVPNATGYLFYVKAPGTQQIRLLGEPSTIELAEIGVEYKFTRSQIQSAFRYNNVNYEGSVLSFGVSAISFGETVSDVTWSSNTLTY